MAMREVWMGLRGGDCVSDVELTIGGEGMGMAQREGVLDNKGTEAWEAAKKDGEAIEGWKKLIGVLEEENV